MSMDVYFSFQEDGGLEITTTPPSSRVDSMDLSKPREVVDSFNALPHYLDYPAPLSNRWVFCVWSCGLGQPADFLVLLNPRVDFVHVDGPHTILSRNVIEQGVIVSRLLMESFVNGMNTHINWQIAMAMRDNKLRKRRADNLEDDNEFFTGLNGLFIQDTAPDKVAPWTWACNQGELAKAVSANFDAEAIAHKRLIPVHPMLEREEKKMGEVLSALSRLIQYALATEVLRLQTLVNEKGQDEEQNQGPDDPEAARMLKVAYICPKCEWRSEVDYRRSIYPHLARLGYTSGSAPDSNGNGGHAEETGDPEKDQDEARANGDGENADENNAEETGDPEKDQDEARANGDDENADEKNAEETGDPEKDQDKARVNGDDETSSKKNSEETIDAAKNQGEEQANGGDENSSENTEEAIDAAKNQGEEQANGDGENANDGGDESNDLTGAGENPDNNSNNNGDENDDYDDDDDQIFFDGRVPPLLFFNTFAAQNPVACRVAARLNLMLPTNEDNHITDIAYPVRRLVITAHDNYETMELLFGPHWYLSMKLRDILRRHRLMAMMSPPFGAPMFGRFHAWDEGSPFKYVNGPTGEEYDQLIQIFRLQSYLRREMDYERRKPREAEIQRVRNEHLESVHRMTADMLMDIAIDGLDQNVNLFDVWR